MHHIKVDGVYTKSGGASITLGNTLCDSEIGNIHAEGCLTALTTVNFDHLGPTRLVKRGTADDPNFPEEGISMERVYIHDVYATLPEGQAAIDLSVMRDFDFVSDCQAERIFCKNGPATSTADGITLPVV